MDNHDFHWENPLYGHFQKLCWHNQRVISGFPKIDDTRIHQPDLGIQMYPAMSNEQPWPFKAPQFPWLMNIGIPIPRSTILILANHTQNTSTFLVLQSLNLSPSSPQFHGPQAELHTSTGRRVAGQGWLVSVESLDGFWMFLGTSLNGCVLKRGCTPKLHKNCHFNIF